MKRNIKLEWKRNNMISQRQTMNYFTSPMSITTLLLPLMLPPEKPGAICDGFTKFRWMYTVHCTQTMRKYSIGTSQSKHDSEIYRHGRVELVFFFFEGSPFALQLNSNNGCVRRRHIKDGMRHFIAWTQTKALEFACGLLICWNIFNFSSMDFNSTKSKSTTTTTHAHWQINGHTKKMPYYCFCMYATAAKVFVMPSFFSLVHSLQGHQNWASHKPNWE